jgi:membrane-associated phospholipid phosphatase
MVGLCFFLCMALGGWVRGAEGAGTAVLFYGGLLAATAWLARRISRGEPGPALRNLHAAWALVALTGAFSGLRWLVAAAAPPERRFDGALAAMDRDWFGVDVPRWSEGFLTAPVADVFMVFYALYFLMPVAALAALWVRGERERIYRAVFTVAVGLHGCYMLYLLVPAAGPRHAYVGLSEPLPRGWITGPVHDFIRDLEPQPFDAFPSAHVVLGLLCAAVAWPVGGWFRWTMAVVGVGTAASTVVLRYHWLVDVFAGLVLVLVALAAAEALARRAARKRSGDHDRMAELVTDRSPGTSSSRASAQ